MQVSYAIRAVGWIEAGLWALGTSALFVVGYVWSDARDAQQHGAQELRELILTPSLPRPASHEGSLVGRVEIARLNISAMIFEGTSERTLDRGVGHLTSSAKPEGSGNVVLAAHRDTFFRPLQSVRVGDGIVVTTPQGQHRYEVKSTEIVQPTNVSVIQPTSENTLTLITCYPFTFVGAAPERFIVHADRSK
ncbi:MAG: class D sortase [Bryobacteraceae bacterium]